MILDRDQLYPTGAAPPTHAEVDALLAGRDGTVPDAGS